MSRVIDRIGHTYGQLTVIGRAGSSRVGHAAWDCVCSCGETLVATGTNLATGNTTRCRKAEHSGKWKGDDIGYNAAHDRVRVRRGRADQHGCVDCDGTAEHWSYSNSDPDERVEVRGELLFRYSTSVIYYAARCRSCHFRFDCETGAQVPVNVKEVVR